MPLIRVNGLPVFNEAMEVAFPMKDSKTDTILSCSISSEALEDKFGARGDHLQTFIEHRAVIESKASSKYKNDGKPVFLRTADF